MELNTFLQRKNSVLSKLDKSSKGNWDKHIAKLCKKINLLKNSYTTSSCAGRIVLMISQDKKEPKLFQFVSHEKISLRELKFNLNKILLQKNLKEIKFKQDPCILHVACATLNDAWQLYSEAKLVGWKRSGMISWKKNFVLELNSTEKLEFPVIKDGKLLVDDEFLRLIVKQSNKNFKKSWDKIKKLTLLI